MRVIPLLFLLAGCAAAPPPPAATPRPCLDAPVPKREKFHPLYGRGIEPVVGPNGEDGAAIVATSDSIARVLGYLEALEKIADRASTSCLTR